MQLNILFIIGLILIFIYFILLVSQFVKHLKNKYYIISTLAQSGFLILFSTFFILYTLPKSFTLPFWNQNNFLNSLIRIGLISAIGGSFLWVVMMEMLEFESTLVLKNSFLKKIMYILFGINIGFILIDCSYYWNVDHFDIQFQGSIVLNLLIFTFAIFIIEQLLFLGHRILKFKSLKINASIIDFSPHYIIFYLSSMVIAFLTAIMYIFKLIQSSYLDWIVISIFSEIIFCYLIFKIPLLFLSTEEPALLLVISNSGTSLYTKKFDSKMSFSEQLLGAYLNAIDILGSNIISNSGSVNSIKFQDKFNMAIKGVFFTDSSIKFCYIYKGISYYAPQRLDKFVNLISSHPIISNRIENLIQQNRVIYDFKEFEDLISQCFSFNSNYLKPV